MGGGVELGRGAGHGDSGRAAAWETGLLRVGMRTKLPRSAARALPAAGTDSVGGKAPGATGWARGGSFPPRCSALAGQQQSGAVMCMEGVLRAARRR